MSNTTETDALTKAATDAEAFAAAAKSPSTIRSYTRQWRAFATWCHAHDLASLPTSPEALSLYLAARAGDGLKVSTLNQALAAIAAEHRAHGFAAPNDTWQVQRVWLGIRRTCGGPPRQVAAATSDVLRTMVGSLPKSTIGARDRALLVIGFAGGFRRSELVALDLEHVAFTPDGLVITVTRSKTDQESAGATVGLPPGSDPTTCPARVLRAWINRSGIKSGPLFRSIRSGGKIGDRLTGTDVARIVKKAAEAAGLDASRFSGNSLRAGLATSAARSGKSDHAIMKQGRWTSVASLDRYIRTGSLLDSDNAAAGIGL